LADASRGPGLSAALIRGLVSTGLDVVDLGAVTTPMLHSVAAARGRHGCSSGIHGFNVGGIVLVTALTYLLIARLLAVRLRAPPGPSRGARPTPRGGSGKAA
jgi:hypothetical protein